MAVDGGFVAGEELEGCVEDVFELDAVGVAVVGFGGAAELDGGGEEDAGAGDVEGLGGFELDELFVEGVEEPAPVPGAGLGFAPEGALAVVHALDQGGNDLG